MKLLDTIAFPMRHLFSGSDNTTADRDISADSSAASVSSRHQAEESDIKTDKTGADNSGKQQDSLTLSREAIELQRLQERDREVRAHEAAHANVGGPYAGAPTYSTTKGPDGKTYATGGEVSIDMSPVAGDPQATLLKAEQVRAAALAPAQPSAQDLKIAQKAQSMATKARGELAEERAEDLSLGDEDFGDSQEADGMSAIKSAGETGQGSDISAADFTGRARLSIYS